jgi:hypothetical protein
LKEYTEKISQNSRKFYGIYIDILEYYIEIIDINWGLLGLLNLPELNQDSILSI